MLGKVFSTAWLLMLLPFYAAAIALICLAGAVSALVELALRKAN